MTGNPVQHGFGVSVATVGAYALPCEECGAPLDVAPRAGRRGPRSKLHPACRVRRRGRSQLRAYLATAARIAYRNGDRELAASIESLLNRVSR